jgi:hypothetical protein
MQTAHIAPCKHLARVNRRSAATEEGPGDVVANDGEPLYSTAITGLVLPLGLLR